MFAYFWMPASTGESQQMGDTVVILSGFTTHCLLAGMFIPCVFVISVFLLAIACVSVLIILTSKCLHVCPVLNYVMAVFS